MRQLDALIIIRENVNAEHLALTPMGKAALKVLDDKIRQLLLKNARRNPFQVTWSKSG